jgi:hypothetical protein
VIYEFQCHCCNTSFDVIKPAAMYNTPETCAKCGEIATRIPFPRKVHLYGTSVQEIEFNHALGKAVTKREASHLAKEKGMIEVGNEDISKHVKMEESNYDDIWQGA